MSRKYPTDEEAKRGIVEFGKRMYARGYVVTNDGNVTVKVGENTIWATPTGVSKGYMNEDMMVKLDLDGTVLEGTRKPSSEIKMHLRVYRENPAVMSVVHAHPVTATTFAIAGIPLNSPILVEAMLQLGVVPVAKYALPGTNEVPDSIAPFCRDYNAVLLSNHGALTWGATLEQAFNRMEVLENYAKIYLNTLLLDKARPLSRRQLEELKKLRAAFGFGDAVLPQGAEEETNTEDICPRTEGRTQP